MHVRVIIFSIFLFLHGCAKPPQNTLAAPVADSIAVTVAPQPSKTAPPMQVAILVSEDIPAYSEVAKHLSRQLGRRGTIYNLSGSQADNLKLIAKFRNEERTQIVSIGLSASLAAKTLTSRQVVFCQVYNYQDYGLLSPLHKGVSMLPSFSRTFSTWRALSPSTTDIGIISGPGFDDAIQVAKTAARIHGLTLHHTTVNSDKEYQYAYKNLNKRVQGYWLLPDNRVLSEHILRDILNYSVRNSKQVAVFSDELLKFGGLFRISHDSANIAQHVYERLEQAQAGDNMPGPDVVYTDKVNLRINPVMAQNLGLKIPKQLRKRADAH